MKIDTLKEYIGGGPSSCLFWNIKDLFEKNIINEDLDGIEILSLSIIHLYVCF